MIPDKYVYLMRKGTRHKIGWSKFPQKRAKTLSKQQDPVELIHVIPSKRAAQVENALKRRFWRKHVGGEWFDLDEEDVRLLCQIQQCDEPSDLPVLLQPRRVTRLLEAGVPEEVYWRFRQLAATSGRTISEELLLLIERHLDDPQLPLDAFPKSIDGITRKKRLPL